MVGDYAPMFRGIETDIIAPDLFIIRQDGSAGFVEVKSSLNTTKYFALSETEYQRYYDYKKYLSVPLPINYVIFKGPLKGIFEIEDTQNYTRTTKVKGERFYLYDIKETIELIKFKKDYDI